jgi:hypothetical protein
MKKIAYCSLLWLLTFAGLACNKEVDSIPVPPFSVYPNPFVADFAVRLENSVPANAAIRFRVLDGKNKPIAVWEDLTPGSSIIINMMDQQKALYYAELQVGNEVFIQPIIKAK